MGLLIAQLLTGLANAAALFMVASGLSLIFGVTRIVNFAHGSFYMLGAFIGYSPYCVPTTVGAVKAVIVNEALRDIEPMAWDFVLNFARDNELQMSEVGVPPEERID